MIVQSHAASTNLRFRRPCQLVAIHNCMKIRRRLTAMPLSLFSLLLQALLGEWIVFGSMKFIGCKKLVRISYSHVLVLLVSSCISLRLAYLNTITLWDRTND